MLALADYILPGFIVAGFKILWQVSIINIASGSAYRGLMVIDEIQAMRKKRGQDVFL